MCDLRWYHQSQHSTQRRSWSRSVTSTELSSQFCCLYLLEWVLNALHQQQLLRSCAGHRGCRCSVSSQQMTSTCCPQDHQCRSQLLCSLPEATDSLLPSHSYLTLFLMGSSSC